MEPLFTETKNLDEWTALAFLLIFGCLFAAWLYCRIVVFFRALNIHIDQGPDEPTGLIGESEGKEVCIRLPHQLCPIGYQACKPDTCSFMYRPTTTQATEEDYQAVDQAIKDAHL